MDGSRLPEKVVISGLPGGFVFKLSARTFPDTFDTKKALAFAPAGALFYLKIKFKPRLRSELPAN